MRHDVIYRRDPDGLAVVGVRLTNRPVLAWTDRATYDRILRANGHSPWFAHANGKGHVHVAITRAGERGPDRLARMIAAASPRTFVRYLDGDRFNLRPANLFVLQLRPPHRPAGAQA